jgi:hypothetical protein
MEKPYTCEDCKYKLECEKQFGPEQENGDDYRAIIGTHFCLRSWDAFKNIGINYEN